MLNPFRRKSARRDAKSLTPDGLPISRLSPELTTLLRMDGFGGTYSRIYATQPNVRTVVDTIAREAAELSLKHYVKVPRSPVLPAGRLSVDDDALSALLAEPTPGEPPYDFWFATIADLLIYEYVVWRVVDNPPKALIRISPELVSPDRNPLPPYNIQGWRASDGTKIPNNELIIMWGYDPATSFSAISPMETLRRLLAESYLRDQHQSATWRQGLRKDGVIEPHVDAQKMSDEQTESYRLDLMDALAGEHGAAGVAILNPGHTWNDVQWSPKDAEYLQTRRLTRLEAAAAFHMPPAIVAASQNGLEASEADYKLFLRRTLAPTLTRVEQNVNTKLLSRFFILPQERKRHYVEFNMDDKLRASFEERAAIGATTAGGPVVLLNEARARLNLPPIEGGDRIIVPLNVMMGGGPQVAPTAPTDTPADGLQPVGVTPVPRGTQSETIEELYSKALEDMERKERDRKQEAFLRETRARYDERFAGALEKFFERQRRSPRPLKRSRWDKELADDLYALEFQLTEVVGEKVAEIVKGNWDQTRTSAYTRARADSQAKAQNEETQTRLDAGSDEDTIFGGDRARQLATQYVTTTMAWSSLEVARQNGELR